MQHNILVVVGAVAADVVCVCIGSRGGGSNRLSEIMFGLCLCLFFICSCLSVVLFMCYCGSLCVVYLRANACCILSGLTHIITTRVGVFAAAAR